MYKPDCAYIPSALFDQLWIRPFSRLTLLLQCRAESKTQAHVLRDLVNSQNLKDEQKPVSALTTARASNCLTDRCLAISSNMHSQVAEDAELILRERLLDADPAERDDASPPAQFAHELRGLLALSAPVMVQLSAQYAVTLTNQYYIGHQGASPLAAAAIGDTVRCCAYVRRSCVRKLMLTRSWDPAVVQYMLVLPDGRVDRP